MPAKPEQNNLWGPVEAYRTLFPEPIVGMGDMGDVACNNWNSVLASAGMGEARDRHEQVL